MRRFVTGLVFAFPLVAFGGHAFAQQFTTGACEDSSNGRGWFGGDRVRVCELRRTTLPLVNGRVSVEGKNGSIDVVGEDRKDIALEVQVTAEAKSQGDAEAMLRKIEILTKDTIHANGPEPNGTGLFAQTHQQWSANYRLHVPRRLAANLHTLNGSVKLTDLDGAISAETTNGSVTLTDLAGDVRARTTNGSLHVALEGTQWHGAGLSARTTNGGVSVTASQSYSAHLVAETVNGGLHVGLPMSGQGSERKHVDGTIGQGGPTVEFETVNGGVHIGTN